MNRPKRLGILLGVLALTCVATFAVMRMEERKEQIKETGQIILELPSESVQSLSWEYSETSLAFHRDGVWLWDEDEQFPVSEEKINDLLEPFQALGAAFIIQDVEDFGQYGLDDPVCTIQLSTEERDYEIKLGDYSKMDSQRYLSIGDGNVYLVKRDPLEELSPYGLDTPELSVTVNYTAKEEDGTERSDTFVLHISRDPEEKKAAEEQEDEEITAYARVGDSKIVYQISSAGYKHLLAASYNDLRHLEVLPASFEDVRQVDIALEGGGYTLICEQDGKERVWSYQGEELEIDSLQRALEGLTAEEFTTEKPSKKEEIGLTVYLDREGADAVRIKLYRHNGETCIAEVDGESICLVDRADVVSLIEAIHAITLA